MCVQDNTQRSKHLNLLLPMYDNRSRPSDEVGFIVLIFSSDLPALYTLVLASLLVKFEGK